jgi:hypothetical protein
MSAFAAPEQTFAHTILTLLFPPPIQVHHQLQPQDIGPYSPIWHVRVATGWLGCFSSVGRSKKLLCGVESGFHKAQSLNLQIPPTGTRFVRIVGLKDRLSGGF